MDDDSGLDDICGGGSDGEESDCPNVDDDSGLVGSDGEGVDWREIDRANQFWQNGLMDRRSAELAEERGQLKELPSREAWSSLREILIELYNRPQPRVDKITELLGKLLIQVHDDENIPLHSTSAVLCGDKKRYKSTPYDYNTLKHTGYLDGVVNVWKAVKGMAPVSFGRDRFDFEQFCWQIEATIHRWLNMRPGGADSVFYAGQDVVESDPFVEEVQKIRRGEFDYNSDDERVKRDSYEDEATKRLNDDEECQREQVRHQASHFARNELAELVDFLKRTPYGTDLYERFRQELTARYNRGSYPTVPIKDKLLEKFLIPRKNGSAERDI